MEESEAEKVIEQHKADTQHNLEAIEKARDTALIIPRAIEETPTPSMPWGTLGAVGASLLVVFIVWRLRK